MTNSSGVRDISRNLEISKNGAGAFFGKILKKSCLILVDEGVTVKFKKLEHSVVHSEDLILG